MDLNTPSSKPKLADGILSVAPKQYIDVLLMLHKKLDSRPVEWAVGGDLGEVLRTINVEPDCLEILTSRKGAEQIAHTLAEFNPEEISLKVQQLPRDATIQGHNYPVYTRSYYTTFSVGTVKVKVHGDLQYRVDDWDWGDKFEFTPEHVYIAGAKTAVVPLSARYELHQLLGWGDRANKVRDALEKQRPHKSQAR